MFEHFADAHDGREYATMAELDAEL